jgi:iron complex transport system substrate-binding protein
MPLVSAEALVKGNPDIIIHTGVVGKEDIRRRPGWTAVTAVRTGRILQVNADDLSRAGPRILDGWENLLDRLSEKNP